MVVKELEKKSCKISGAFKEIHETSTKWAVHFPVSIRLEYTKFSSFTMLLINLNGIQGHLAGVKQNLHAEALVNTILLLTKWI